MALQKYINFLKKNWVVLALLLVIIGAVFVRVYHFDEWLYFKMDQSRDAILIGNAIQNGPQDLPLLGARVGAIKLQHGFLRLGPIFYYFQYLSGVIFQSTKPPVLAYPDLLFSILALPLLFLFARLYFSQKYSLLITAMYSFSFLIIQYSRFAWNPNSLQFFLLLSFYGLLRFLNEEDLKRKKWWLITWSIGMIIGSQLHFFGFFTLLGVSGLVILFHFQLWKKEQIALCFGKEVLKKIALSAGIIFLVFGIFYAPVIISDSQKNWQNSKNFIEAFGAKPVQKPFTEKVVKSVTESMRYYCLLTTSQCYEGSLKNERPSIIFTGLILLFGLILIIRGIYKKQLSPLKKDFLALLIFWSGIFFILTVPVSFQLRPRFFIVVFAIPFLFSGLIFEYLEERFPKKHMFVLFLLFTLGIVGWNTKGTMAWFKEQAKSQIGTPTIKRTLILKAKDGVTLGQLQGVTDWMYTRHVQGDTLYYYVKPEHERPIEFLLGDKRDTKLHATTMKMSEDPHAQFFAVTPTKSGITPFTKKFGTNITVIDSKQFGQLTVYEVTFPNRVVSESFQFKKSKTTEDRLFWKDILKVKTTTKN